MQVIVTVKVNCKVRGQCNVMLCYVNVRSNENVNVNVNGSVNVMVLAMLC